MGFGKHLGSCIAAALWIGLLGACDDENEDALDGFIQFDAGASEDSGADRGALDADAGADGGALDADAGTDGGTEDGGTSTSPIEAPDRTWTWVPFPESRCIDNSPTGIGVNLVKDATEALIFLQGGNACFNLGSCLITANTDGYGQTKFEGEIAEFLNASAFERSNPENPYRNATYIYVPYCTGDVHAGSKRDGVAGGSTRQFVGFTNIHLFLDRVVPTLAGVDEIILTGVSAGGFGASILFDSVQQRFGDNVRVTLINDSGPPMGHDFVQPCLQQHFRQLWGLDQGPLANCTTCDTHPEGGFIEEYFVEILQKYPDRNFGVLSSEGDSVIRSFWGYGEPTSSGGPCAGIEALFPQTYTAEKFLLGLEDLRDRIMGPRGNGRVFLTEGTGHVLLNPENDTAPEDTEREGFNLFDWIGAAFENSATWVNVPAP